MTAFSCDQVREAISAAADGEDPGLSDEARQSHLAGCDACQAFITTTAELRRRTAPLTAALRAQEPPSKLTERILALPLPSGKRRAGRAWLAAGVAAAVVAVGAFGVGSLLAGGSGSKGTTIQQVSGSTQTSSQYPGATVLPTAVAKPTVVLTSTSGQPYDLASQTAGRVTLLYFGYTHCPDVCPINMALAAQALRLMPAAVRQQVDVVFVTTDPARDTPAVMRAWLDHFSPSFVGLVGSISTIHQAESTVGMELSVADRPADGGYTVEHAGYTLVYAQDGQSHIQIDNTETPAQYATTLEHLITHGFQAAH